MANEYTYSKSNSSGLVADGDYEAIIERIERKTTNSGKEKLSIMYRIRDDIEGQAYGNKPVFEDIWKEKDSPEHFNRKRINQLLGTQEIEDGTVFETINDIIDTLVGSNIILHITTTLDEYRGEDVNKVSYYKTSKAKPKTFVPDAYSGKQQSGTWQEVTPDDIPF